MESIKAPFTEEQVKLLNEYQSLGIMHQFTCTGQLKLQQVEITEGVFKTVNEKTREDCPNEGTLIATTDGWVCPCGQYKQDWAHKFMLNVEGLKNSTYGRMVLKTSEKK